VIVKPLVGKQLVSYDLSTARLNIYEGAVRSSKTIGSLLRWIKVVREAPPGAGLIMIGKTERTLKRNILDVLTAMLGKRRCRINLGNGEMHMLGRTVYLMGAANETASDKLKGLSLYAAYVDEITTLPESFWAMLLTRLSTAGACLLGTTNPEGPQHWLLTDYLERAALWVDRDGQVLRDVHPEPLDLHRFSFQLEDNPNLPDDYVDNIRREHVGLWRRRLILGEWCLAEGVVFEMWDPKTLVVTDLPRIEEWIAVGIDYGTTNPFHAVLIGLAQGRLYVTNEWRWDSKKRHRSLTDSEYSQHVRDWLTGLGVHPRYTVIDPSAASFRVQMFRDGWTSAAADNDVLDGIRDVASLFATRRLLVHASCKGLIGELPSYAWDPEKSKKGEDAPIKLNDHACLVAGTSVVTATGERPVELVAPGELVLTRDGWRPVVAAGVTDPAAPVLEIALSDGRTLTGTGNHPVWVTGRGWVRLDALRYADRLSPWQDAWMCAPSTGSSSVATPTPQAPPNGPTTCQGSPTDNAASGGYTKRCGSHTTALSPTGTTCTTSTTTPSTTSPPTSPPSPRTNTAPTTPPSDASPGCTTPPSGWPTSTPSDRLPLSGTAAPRVAPGTPSTPVGHGKAGSPSLARASSAAPATTPCPATRTVTGSAPTPARAPGGVLPVSTTRTAPADCAGPDSGSTGSAAPASVAVHVVGVRSLPGRVPVWNLSVADCPEYYASGVLVHNCDALRYAIRTTEAIWRNQLAPAA
jgi:PBSX family phage terminase large subunit